MQTPHDDHSESVLLGIFDSRATCHLSRVATLTSNDSPWDLIVSIVHHLYPRTVPTVFFSNFILLTWLRFCANGVTCRLWCRFCVSTVLRSAVFLVLAVHAKYATANDNLNGIFYSYHSFRYYYIQLNFNSFTKVNSVAFAYI